MLTKVHRIAMGGVAGFALAAATLAPAATAQDATPQTAREAPLQAPRAAITIGRGDNSAISPDGRTVVYQAGHLRGRRNPETSPGRLMMWQDGRVRELLRARTRMGVHGSFDPFYEMHVTDGGRYVVFASGATTLTKKKMKPEPRCYVWTRRTRTVTALANGKPCFVVDLTADGQLYYRAASRGPEFRVHVVDISAPDKVTLVDLPTGESHGSLKISLNGLWYAYEKDSILSTADIATRTTTAIEQNDLYNSPFVISPSGRFVAYVDAPYVGGVHQGPLLMLWDRTTGTAAELDRGRMDGGIGVVGVSDAGRVVYTHPGEAGPPGEVRVRDILAGSTTVLARGYHAVTVPDAAVSRVLVQDESTRKELHGQTPDGESSWTELTNPKIRLLSLS